tara:strand:+ start:112 stop:462 length:351 start_codon:yes stop_codon:yes gene_type:complete
MHRLFWERLGIKTVCAMLAKLAVFQPMTPSDGSLGNDETAFGTVWENLLRPVSFRHLGKNRTIPWVKTICGGSGCVDEQSFTSEQACVDLDQISQQILFEGSHPACVFWSIRRGLA